MVLLSKRCNSMSCVLSPLQISLLDSAVNHLKANLKSAADLVSLPTTVEELQKVPAKQNGIKRNMYHFLTFSCECTIFISDLSEDFSLPECRYNWQYTNKCSARCEDYAGCSWNSEERWRLEEDNGKFKPVKCEIVSYFDSWYDNMVRLNGTLRLANLNMSSRTPNMHLRAYFETV